MTKVDEATEKWIAEQDNLIEQGERLARDASNEALEYVRDAMENIADRQWRKMSVSTQAVEMGVGLALAEYIIPGVYKDMEKNMHKRLKIDKNTATALRHIYIGRVIKNIRKALNERHQ